MRALKAFFKLVIWTTTIGETKVRIYASAVLLNLGMAGIGLALMAGVPLWATIPFSLLATASMAVHEGGHCLAARKHGMGVSLVEFKWFGAATHHDDVTSRRALVWLSATGVIGNMVAAGVLFALAAPFGSSVIGVVLGAAASFNVIVAAFNILPVLPMDGGLLTAALLGVGKPMDVAWRRVRYLNIVLMGVLMVLTLTQTDLMMALYAGCVLLHLWLAGEKPAPDFAQA